MEINDFCPPGRDSNPDIGAKKYRAMQIIPGLSAKVYPHPQNQFHGGPCPR